MAAPVLPAKALNRLPKWTPGAPASSPASNTAKAALAPRRNRQHAHGGFVHARIQRPGHQSGSTNPRKPNGIPPTSRESVLALRACAKRVEAGEGHLNEAAAGGTRTPPSFAAFLIWRMRAEAATFSPWDKEKRVCAAAHRDLLRSTGFHFAGHWKRPNETSAIGIRRTASSPASVHAAFWAGSTPAAMRLQASFDSSCIPRLHNYSCPPRPGPPARYGCSAG